MLDRIGTEKARATTIVKFEPNSKFPTHTHIGGEEFLVLEGRFQDEFGVFPAGTYVRNPIGSIHEPWVEEDGCTIMVKLLQMADTKDLDKPLYISLEEAKNKSSKTGFGQRAQLYSNQATGELVQMCWVEAHEYLEAEELLGGEELFVMKGSVLHDGNLFEQWGWLRFPPGTKRSEIKGGPDGAQLFRKTGHLTEKALSMEKIKVT